MIKIRLIIIIAVILTRNSDNIIGQGCSDAGFCTINSFKPSSTDSTIDLNNQFKVGISVGKADKGIMTFGNYIEYSKIFGDKWSLNAKLTTIAQNGNGMTTFGLSDFFVNADYKMKGNFKVTLGTKIPLSSANKTKNSRPLPMDYQASLGTFDFIFGIGYEFKNIQFVAAIQQPLTQNDNQFLASDYATDSFFKTFQSTNKFKRSGDILIRISYPFTLGSKFKLTPSILPIYHLSNDQFTDESNTTREIYGSRGLTLNSALYFDYEINRKSQLQINISKPFVVRDSRPDGLTRSYLVNIEYKMKF